MTTKMTHQSLVDLKFNRLNFHAQIKRLAPKSDRRLQYMMIYMFNVYPYLAEVSKSLF